VAKATLLDTAAISNRVCFTKGTLLGRSGYTLGFATDFDLSSGDTNVTLRVYLAPDEHGAEDDLKSVEEVVSDDDDRRSAGRPALTRTDGLDRRRRRTQEPYRTRGKVIRLK